jgi:hypothetical protein
MLEQELISKQQVEEESQRLKDEIRGHSFRFPLSLIWSQELMACIVVRLSDLQTEVSVLKQTRPRIPSSNHLPPPQPHMPSLLESSQELSMSDLEPNATFLSNSNPTSSSANEPTLSPTITIRQSLEAPTSPSPGQTSFPSSSGVVRSASSPVVSRIPPSPSRLPMMTSPSRLPKSTTYAKNLASFALDSPVAGGGPSSPLARPRQPPSKANIQSSSNARTAPHVPDSRSKGVRMVSDLGERVRTLQSRIQTQTIPRSRRVHLPLVDSPVSTTSRPTPAAAHPRTRALASASGSGLKSPGRALSVAAAAGAGGEGTPGTPGDSWVMVPEHDGPLSPSPTLSSEHADSRLSRGISRSKSSNGTTVPPLRQSSSQKPPSISTRALPSRPGIPSPLSTAPTPAYYASTSTSRPPSRISTLSRSTNASSHSRPTTPTFLNMPSLPSSSMPQRSTSPLPSMDGSSGVKFPSRSNSPAFGLGGTAGSTSSRLPSISRPKVLGHHQSYKSTHPSTPSASSSSSGASELARPSRRRTSLTASSINGNGNGSSHLPAPSSSSTTRGTAPRISFGSSSSSSRPVSAPVPPHSPAPPVPVIPSHLRKPSNGLGIAGKGMKMMGRKRSATGGAEGKLI